MRGPPAGYPAVMARSDKDAAPTGKGSPPRGQARSGAKTGGGAKPTQGSKPTQGAKLTQEEKQEAKELKREQRKGRMGRRMLKIGFLRRRYIKRVLRSIEKSKEKGKRMPPELWDLSKRLDRLPPGKRVEFLEQAITAGPEAQEQAGRAMRRAAASQERLSGRGGGRSRPGMGPMPPGARRGKPR